jgi:hypothetical protein
MVNNMSRSKLRFFLISLFSFFLFILITNQRSFAENWVLHGKTGNGTIQFIDKDSITKLSSENIRIWLKAYHVMDELQNFRDKSVIDDKYSSYSHSIYLWEINCKMRTSKLLYFADYDKTDHTLNFQKYENSSFDYIIPGSVSESLYKKCCYQTKKNN